MERTFAPRSQDDETNGTVPSPASLSVPAKLTACVFLSIDAVVQVTPPQPQTFVSGRVSNCCGNGPCAFAARSRMYCSLIHDGSARGVVAWPFWPKKMFSDGSVGRRSYAASAPLMHPTPSCSG